MRPRLNFELRPRSQRVSYAPSCAWAKVFAYQRYEVAIQAIFRNTSLGARAKGQNGAFVPWVGEEAENAHGGIEFANFPNRPDAIGFRKIQIHQNHVGSVLAKQLNCLAGRCRDSHEVHVRLKMDQAAEALPQKHIVIHDQNSALLLHGVNYSKQPCLAKHEIQAPRSTLFQGCARPQMAISCLLMVATPCPSGPFRPHKFAWLLSLFVLHCANLAAIDPHQPITQMYHAAWSAKEGVIGEALAIAQTSDGFIWVGTTGGLLRFDGSEFERYKPEVGSFPEPSWVSALLATSDDGLWIGNLSGGASFLKRGKITNYGEPEGLPPGRIRSFAQDNDGTIWAATAGGLGHFDGLRWRWVGKNGNPSGLPSDPISSVAVNRQGVWVSDSNKGVFFLARGARAFQPVMPQPVPGYLPTFTEAGEEEMWLWVPESLALLRFPVPAPHGNRPLPGIANSAGMFLIDGDGSGWMMTRGEGVWRIPAANRLNGQISLSDPSIERFSENEGLTSATVYCAMEDREGDIWVGTLGGLDRFRPRNAAWTQLQTVPTQRMQLVAGDKGEVWASSPQGLWDARSGKKVQGSPPNIHFSFRDPEGPIWFWSGQANSGDFWRWEGGQFQKAMSPTRWNSNPAADLWVPAKGPVRALTRDGDGEMWVSIRGGGVWRLHDGVWKRVEILKDALDMTAYGAICDEQGRVWLAYPERREIGLWDHGAIRVFSAENGLNVGAVTQIAYTDGHIWAGGEFGLAFYSEGRFHTVEPAEGAKFGLVAGIAGASNSGLWLSTTTEIIHIPENEVSLVVHNWGHRVRYETFDPVSDLAEPPSHVSDTPAVMGTDGILWVATRRGVIRVDPAHFHRNRTSPQMAIRNLIANGKSYSMYGPITLPPHTTDLRIAYSVLSFPIPERVRSRYRLLGWDKEWQDAGSRVEATYKNLKPGGYTFQLVARNNDGVWNMAGPSLEFTIQPAFYQTLWFQLVYILSGAFLLWLLYRLRLRQATARVQLRYAERLAERTRIARELHDTLLQSLAGVSLQLDGIAKQAVSGSEKFAFLVNQVREMVDICFLEARAKVWTLRSTSLEGPGLAATLGEFCERIRPLTTAHCEFHLVGEPHPLAPEHEEELLRIAQEGVHNAIRHAQAQTIQVMLEYSEKLLVLTVSDDGRGFDVEEGLRKSDHWGLKNMRERAAQVRSTYNLTSAAGRGTRVEVRVQMPA
jgi:signal transduction histidine kinase/ligand-binding sensor domain-containing protein